LSSLRKNRPFIGKTWNC